MTPAGGTWDDGRRRHPAIRGHGRAVGERHPTVVPWSPLGTFAGSAASCRPVADDRVSTPTYRYVRSTPICRMISRMAHRGPRRRQRS
ncbi:MAG: hypothetical protein ACRCYR_01945 [Phycicoccus sp.]